MPDPELAPHIRLNVANSLNEDVLTGDLTAQLLPPALVSSAQVITRQQGVLCGTQWFDECFRMQSLIAKAQTAQSTGWRKTATGFPRGNCCAKFAARRKPCSPPNAAR